MRKTNIWHIPCAFFIVASILNLIGCIQGTALAATVKPALLPLLSATTLAYLLGRNVKDYKGVGLLTAAQLFGCTGDVLLIPDGFLFFASGIVAFLIGHVFYMCLFGGRSWKGLTLKHWIIAFVVMIAAVLGLVKAIGIEGAMFWPMLIYGFGLMMLIFSTLAGAIRFGSPTWWILLVGALLFTFSDSCIAMGTFGVMTFPLRGFLVMITYLLAQSLLAIGGARLVMGE